MNYILLLGAVALIALLVSDLSGQRAGLLSGLMFAMYGHIAGLVAWVSCDQDLLAIVFVLAAFWFRHRRRELAAFGCAVVAVLCKEPAMAALPVLIAWDGILGRPTNRPGLRIAVYTMFVAAWAAIHPGIHSLAVRSFRSGATGYVGIEHPERWGIYFTRYIMTLLNLPPFGFMKPWPRDLTLAGLTALALVVAGLLRIDRGPEAASRADRADLPRRVASIGLLFAIPALLMPTLLIRHWAPYFASIPAAGAAIAAGPWLARLSRRAVLFALSMFLILGVWYRGIVALSEAVWSEAVFVDADRATKIVRKNFRILYPTFPKGSQVVVSTGTTGVRGVYGTLIYDHALQTWYGDSTLRTVTPLTREPGAASEFLLRVTTDLEVLSIDPDARRVRSSSPRAPDLSEIDRPLRNYARAVAAGGNPRRALSILNGLRRAGPPEARAYAERLIVAILLSTGRDDEARRILQVIQPLRLEEARTLVHRLLAEASASESLDLASFPAFGLSLEDPDDVRWIMRQFREDGSLAQAAWWAQRVTLLAPNDSEAASVTRDAVSGEIVPSRLPG
ncbi:MAG: hypothetical protein AABZ94_09930 [Candidatus Eisenbacteria bacterium]